MSQTTSPDTLDERFAAWRAAGRCALIPYLTCGFPHPGDTGALLDALADAGADVIELGVPFSDPVADGPTIQRSSQQALAQGVTLASTLAELASFRARRDTAVVLFTYLNPLLRYGAERFVRDASAAGAQGVLVTDLPTGGDPALEALLGEGPLRLIRLVAPTTGAARAQEIVRAARGFVYYIARTGVTGASSALRATLERDVEALRRIAPVPVAVGFGISTPAQAARVARVADGVIVGSALIAAIEQGGVAAAGTLIGAMRAAIDGAASN